MPKAQKDAYTNLYYASQLFNQAVGDAICDALFVEAILTTQEMSVQAGMLYIQTYRVGRPR